MFPGVTCAIPGAKHPAQAEENIKAADLAPLSDDTMKNIQSVYESHVKAEVHQYW